MGSARCSGRRSSRCSEAGHIARKAARPCSARSPARCGRRPVRLRSTLVHGSVRGASGGGVGEGGGGGGVGGAPPPPPPPPPPAVPFKANAARRHRIPRQRHRVTNWAAYEAALRQRGGWPAGFPNEPHTAGHASPAP